MGRLKQRTKAALITITSNTNMTGLFLFKYLTFQESQRERKY